MLNVHEGKKKKAQKSICRPTSFLRVFYILILCFDLQIPVYAKEQIQSNPTSLKVVVSPYLSYLPFYIAQEAGYFTEQNLQVELIKMLDPSDAMPALIKGEVHVLSFIILPGQFNAMARGARLRIVADKGHFSSNGCTETALMARRRLVEEGKLAHPSQLKGCRIAMIDISSSAGYFIDKVLAQGGLTTNDVEILSLPMTTRLEAFQRGVIDITLASEPWITRMLQGGHAAIWKPAHQIIPDFQLAFLLYGPALLEKDQDAGRRFMVSYLKAVRQYRQGKTEQNLKIAGHMTGLDQELLRKTCWPTLRRDGEINTQSILGFQAWAVKRGFQDKVVPPNQFWDPSFIEYANKILGTANN